ncbi:MAG TPA: HisA/HisF-related TIM barrel protein [Gammaproteobacteria bacterium]|nr:HisA/HisF-related TIM barrel protein [Gammaproteobacteria bacterium]
MATTRRIIPCLDINRGRVVKGIRLENVDNCADPVAVSTAFADRGADELALLDVSSAGRADELAAILKKVSERVFVPVIAGGGIAGLPEIQRMLGSGADKVMLNTAAVLDPELVTRAVKRFGGEAIIGAVDVRRRRSGEEITWEVMTHGGRKASGLDAREWVQRLVDMGVGEIVLTSLDRDGTRKGFDLALVENIAAICGAPLVVAGGAGEPQDLAEVFQGKLADGAMVASIFHSGDYGIGSLKEFLSMRGLDIRP